MFFEFDPYEFDSEEEINVTDDEAMEAAAQDGTLAALTQPIKAKPRG